MFTGILEALLLAAVVGQTEELAEPPHNPEPPLTITIAGPVDVRGPRDLELVLEITRHMPDDVPMVVHVTLPDGVVQLGGKTDYVLGDARSQLIVQRIPLRASRLPEGDVVVTVDARSASYGVHATAVYRFGRTAVAPRRQALGPALRGPGGAILGRPVALDRKR